MNCSLREIDFACNLRGSKPRGVDSSVSRRRFTPSPASLASKCTPYGGSPQSSLRTEDGVWVEGESPFCK